MGTIVSISGALVVVLYKGPKLFSSSSWTSSFVLLQWPPLESSTESNWVVGGVLIAVAYLLYSIWYIIQVKKGYIFIKILVFLFSFSQILLNLKYFYYYFADNGYGDIPTGADCSFLL